MEKKKGGKGGKGCRHILFLVLSFIFTLPVFAQDDISLSTGIIGGGKYQGAKTADNQTTVPVLGVDSSGNTRINALTGKNAGFSVGKTDVFTSDADSFNPAQDIEFPAGKMVAYPVPAVMTPSTAYPTPSAGDTLTEKVSMIATAAPTAVFVELPLATAIPLSRGPLELINTGASPAQIVPKSGDSVNALAAGTPYACATTKLCECRKIAATRYWCIAQ